MILYHGSYTSIEKPDLSFARLRTDFGKGFYLTPLKTQAVNWAERFYRVRGTAVLSAYEFLPNPDDKLPPNIKILEFDTHNPEWLHFITACRLGQPIDTEWDLVIGGVANDKVFDTLQLFFDKLIGAEEAIGRLRYNKPNIQYCFKTQSLIDEYLQFIDSETLK
ncbi:MAG: DUF3990 domain-containing protein [Leptospirales bacterium]|nr:DUF3990 domain-containing protein [Leptospirales bacterium]